jgi:hypothetical protein
VVNNGSRVTIKHNALMKSSLYKRNVIGIVDPGFAVGHIKRSTSLEILMLVSFDDPGVNLK